MSADSEIISAISDINRTIVEILDRSDREKFYIPDQYNVLVQTKYSETEFILGASFGKEHIFFRQFSEINSTKIYEKGSQFTRVSLERLSGLLTSVENLSKEGLLKQLKFQIIARSVNDFVLKGEKNLDSGQKDVAGILLSAALEIAVSDLFEKFEINVEGNLSDRINILKKRDIISDIQKSRLETAARIRNKAFHAKWNEFGELDVRDLIRVVREILLEKLEK